MRFFSFACAFVFLLTACDAEDQSPPATGTSVRLSGTLLSGLATEGVRAGVRLGVRAGSQEGVRAGQEEGVRAVVARGKSFAGAPPRRQSSLAPATPMAGYGLYCLTFQDPPQAQRSTADADGRFALSFEGSDVSIACFVVDPRDQRVADLFFVEQARGPDGNYLLSGTARVGGDTSLGEVLVDLSTLVALADRPSRETLVEPEAWDFTGSWAFGECLDPREGGECGAEDLLRYTAFAAQFPTFYMHRIAGTDASTGMRRYLGNMWSGYDAFVNCGATEGLSRDQTRDGLGIDLDPEVTTIPFNLLDEPPGPSTWDAQDTCMGPLVFDGPDVVTCSDVGDAGARAYCYDRCLTRRLKEGDRSCIRSRTRDEKYIQAYLQRQSEGREAAYDASSHLRIEDFPEQSVLTDLGAPGRHPEIFYSDPNTWSGAIFGVSPFNFLDESGAARRCDIVGSVQLIVARTASGRGEVTAFLGFAHSPAGPDYEWCLLNATEPAHYTVPLRIGTSVRLRGRLEAVP